MKLFSGRKIVIATMHKKEKAMAKFLKKDLGLICNVPNEFNTDLLGTFSGEISRDLSPYQAAKKKCYLAMQKTGLDIAIANEGSFGPHPSLYFIPADEELIILIDKKNNLEIVVNEISTDTNFSAQYITSGYQLKKAAKQMLFPSHGVILKDNDINPLEIIKENANWQELEYNFKYLFKKFGKVYIETDMRAMRNPTRMKVIKNATKKLIDKIKNCCPICFTPGFGVTNSIAGLPCELCNMPTKSILAHESKCAKCGFVQKKMYPYNKQFEIPTFCDFCNP